VRDAPTETSEPAGGHGGPAKTSEPTGGQSQSAADGAPAPETRGPGPGPPDAGSSVAASGRSPGATYAERHDRHLADQRRLGAVSLRFSVARGVTFAAILGCLLLAVAGGPMALPLSAAGTAVAAFAILAVLHGRCLRRLRRAEELRHIAEEGLARLERNWDRLPLPAEPPRDRGLPLARDLDLYGRASLFHLLGTAHTPAAKALLRDWLEGAAPPAEVRERQGAVAELAAQLDFRQLLELALRGMEPGAPRRRAGAAPAGSGGAAGRAASAAGAAADMAASAAGTAGTAAGTAGAAADMAGAAAVGTASAAAGTLGGTAGTAGVTARTAGVAARTAGVARWVRNAAGASAPWGTAAEPAAAPDCEPFLRWAEEDPWLLARPALLWAARAAALVTLATVAAVPRWGLSPLLIMAILNLGLSRACQRAVGSRLERVSASRDEMMRYAAALRHATSRQFDCRRLRALAAALQTAPTAAAAHGQTLASGAPEPAAETVPAAATTTVTPTAAAPTTPAVSSVVPARMAAPTLPAASPTAPAAAPAPTGKRRRQARSAAGWLDLLESRLGWADARHSASLHFLLQVLTLWDFHTLALLEAWQRDAGRQARRWLTALGEIEALAALATLRFENPDWCLPEVAAGLPELAARDLAHPLLPPAGRVGNDVTVGPAGTFLLVTGSNMSGKSTLLRAIGCNVVLAQAGGPACAAALRLPPLRLATSILVEDSLVGGVSFFLAELLRIQQVVAAADLVADGAAARENAGLLYLLDEVLRGTNSVERQIAVRRVLRHLLARGALGAVSTHDLELAAGAGLDRSARLVHFRETLIPGGFGASGTPGAEGRPRMTFDYRLRPGPATTTNALELLRQVGLDFPHDPDVGVEN
jgi:hypothetical protein